MVPFVLAIAAAATICGYNPNSGKPNPLGMRAYIEIVAQRPTRTRFLFDNFGNAAAQGAAKREVDIDAPLAQARTIMRTNPRAYAKLVGAPVDPSDDSYRLLDPLMQCSAATAKDIQRADDPQRIRARFR